MKTVSFAVCFLMAVLNSVMAAELIKVNVFDESDESCEGTPVVEEWKGVVGHCRIVGGFPTKFSSCLKSEFFVASDCSGEPYDSNTDSSSCQPFGPSTSTLECLTRPDHKVGRFQEGTSCTDGEVSDLHTDDVFVLDECMPYDILGVVESYLYTLDDGNITFTTFTGNTDCTGPSESFTIEVGSCVEFTEDTIDRRRRRRRLQEEGGDAIVTARKVTPVVTGATLSNTQPPETSAPSPTNPPTGDDNDGDDDGGKNGTGNGNNAMVGSASVLALVASMIGGLALMF